MDKKTRFIGMEIKPGVVLPVEVDPSLQEFAARQRQRWDAMRRQEPAAPETHVTRRITVQISTGDAPVTRWMKPKRRRLEYPYTRIGMKANEVHVVLFGRFFNVQWTATILPI